MYICTYYYNNEIDHFLLENLLHSLFVCVCVCVRVCVGTTEQNELSTHGYHTDVMLFPDNEIGVFSAFTGASLSRSLGLCVFVLCALVLVYFCASQMFLFAGALQLS